MEPVFDGARPETLDLHDGAPSGNRSSTPAMNAAPSGPLSATGMPRVRLVQSVQAQELDATRTLFQEYADSLGIDLGFQDFERELALLPGDYAEPRGTLLLARVEARAGEDATIGPRAFGTDDQSMLSDSQGARIAGCCALRPLDTVDYPNAAEMKRLYVRPAFRGLGVGRQLAEAILDAARHAGYACVLLDTLDDMESARTLYEDLGFEAVPPYYHNPIAGSHYLKVDL